MLLVLGFSSALFAADTDTLTFDITVEPAMDIWFVQPLLEGYKGVFGSDSPVGEAGIYISDGGATETSALNIWASAISYADENDIERAIVAAYSDGNTLPDPQVDMFKVDANVNVLVTIESDFAGWLNAPTLLRVSSDEEEIQGIGDWSTDLAVIGNEVEQVNNSLYNTIIDYHNEAVEQSDSFEILFGDDYICHGPLEFHLNGALWLPKVSMIAADEYQTDVVITVAALDD
ncbi:MAG: hypothetical protein ACOCRK_04730 [bacterium]